MRRYIIAVLAVLVVLAACWCGFWFYAAQDIETRLAAWAAAQRAQGLTAEYASVTVSGFPLSWHTRVMAPAMSGAGATRWEWRGEEITAEIRPWALHDVPVTFPGVHRVSAGTGGVAETLAIRAARPDGRVQLASDGRLANLTLDIGDAEVRRPPDPGLSTVKRARLSLSPHRIADATYRNDTLDLTLDLDTVTVPEPPRYALGPTIAAARVDLSVKGSLPPGPLGDSVAAWRDAGGVVEINRLALRWGTLDMDGDGTVTLDAENRPLGASTVRIRGYTETVDALTAAGAMRPRDAGALKIALNLFARQNGSGPRELTVPITAQDGKLFVAGFSLFAMPSLVFE
jgi:hypothetical protein